MMKLTSIACGLLAFGSSVAFAQDPTVAITSFEYVGQNSRATEVCGKVTGANGYALVRILVDEHSKNPGVYNTLAGPDGAFCAMAVSYFGTASASVSVFGKTVKSTEAAVSLEAHRAAPGLPLE